MSARIPPPDAHVRDEVLDAVRSFHLESPAGSGKTSLLAARYLRLLALCRPEEVLAVTFTRKAAGELRERILRALNQARHGERPDDAAQALLFDLAAEVVRRHNLADAPLAPECVQVMTFHGLCAWMAERWPLEAGLAPGTRVLDETEVAPLQREALERLRLRLCRLGAESALRQAFERRCLRLDNRWDALEEELAGIISQRDLFADLLALVERGEGELARALGERVAELAALRLARACRLLAASDLGRCWPQFVAELGQRGCDLATSLPASLPEPEAARAGEWAAIACALLTGSGTPRRSFGPALGGYPKGFKKGSPFAPLIEALAPACCEALGLCRALPGPGGAADLAALADLVALAGEATRLYEQLCRERAVVDFAGLEAAALNLLSCDPFPGTFQISDGLLAMDARVRHVLVDEFQDTSRNQWELLRRLCSGFGEGEGRTLFVVGDPKQSIYGFRKAEVALFEQAKGGLPTDGGHLKLTPRQLTANFRSEAGLVGWVNGVFERVMADPFREADEVAFASAEPTRAGEGEVSLSLFSHAAPEPREREARWLAARVRHEAARLLPGERLGVLLFARTHLSAYLRALREAGVAVSVREGLHLADRPEVAGLFALLRALVRPHDDLAWAALLRSPWGLADTSAFCRVATAGGLGWPEKLAASTDPALGRVREGVARGEALVGRVPLAEALKRAWVALRGPEEAARRLGAACLPNCRAVLDLLAACEAADPGASPEEVLAAFEERLEAAWQPPADDRPESAVQLMTVHAAKGLEFDTVFVPFLDWEPLRRGGGRPRPYLLERLPGGGHVAALAPDRRENGDDPVWSLVKGFSNDRRLGEAKRLFYTAATRARKALHLSAVARLGDGALNANGRGPLGWLLEAAGLQGMEAAAVEGAAVNMAIGGMAIRLDPAPEGEAGAATPEAAALSRPSAAREPLRYRKLSASELAGEAAPERHAAGFEPSLEARVRGTLVHRLLERAAAGVALPPEASVAAALASEGTPPERAKDLAAELLSEVRAALADPLLAAGMGAARHFAELALEALADAPPGPERALDVGIIDLLFEDGGLWWVVDYKTTRPEPGKTEAGFLTEFTTEFITEFLAAQRDKYRPQLETYRRLVAAWQKVAPENVRAVLYFTALRQAIEI